MEACTFPGLRVSNTFRGFTSGGPGEKNLSLPTWVCKTAWPAGSCEIAGGGKPDSELQGCENVQLGGGNLTHDLRLALFWGAPKSLQMVTAAMKLKDAYSLEGKL